MSNEVWENIYDRLAEQIQAHHTTLIFANTRRMVERVTRHLSERIGEDNIAAHHGSLAKELRLDAEQRLKAGRLRALVATASLELGIDIGDVELVCQLGTPRSISAFVQRVGRANHAVGGVPKGRLLPLSRDDLVECTRADRCRAPRRARCAADAGAAARRAGTAAGGRGGGARLRRGRAVRAGAPCLALPCTRAATSSTSCCGCWPKASPRGAVGRARTCTATRSIIVCAPGVARGSPPLPAAAPFPTTPITRWCSSPQVPSSVR